MCKRIVVVSIVHSIDLNQDPNRETGVIQLVTEETLLESFPKCFHWIQQ